MDIFLDRAIQWRESWLSANSAVKIAAFFLIWAIAWSPMGIAIAIVSKRSTTELSEIQQKLLMVSSLYILAPPTIWMAAKIEGASFLDYGLVWQPSLLLSILAGLGLGIVGLLANFFIQSFFGWIEWHWQNLQKLQSIILPILILGLGIGFVEELVFRGFLLNELQLNNTYWLAAIISSLIFAFGHLIWERKETIPQLPGLWLLGIVLVLARLVDRGSLGLAWGLHAGWIWGLSCLDSAQLISYSEKYSPLLTGINKQPLAGVAGILCLLGTGAILYFFV
jgi:membrane protease YdiL (CAAX protease family)